MGLSEGWDVEGFDRLGWPRMESRTVLAMLNMLFTAHHAYIKILFRASVLTR